jgi:N-acetylneuraminic acid mutarotase
MIIWGGASLDGNRLRNVYDGAAYDPATDTWRPIAPSPIRPGNSYTAVWTGTEMLIWGGSALRPEGARYNPATDRWTAMSQPVGTAPRFSHTAVWTGTEMLIWGGFGPDDNLADGARYDPVTDTWRPIAPGPLDARYHHTAVWTGSEMIIWGGTGSESAARYNPSADTWALLSAAGAPSFRYNHTAVWTGTEMLIWGGWLRSPRAPRVFADGGRYSPTHDTWAAITDRGAPSPYWEHTAIWTGAEMIVFGRRDDPGRYRPYWLEILQPAQVYGVDDAPLWTAQPSERYRVVDIEDGWALAVWEGNTPDWSVWIPLDSRTELTRG